MKIRYLPLLILTIVSFISFSTAQNLYAQEVISYEDYEVGSIKITEEGKTNQGTESSILARIKTKEGSHFSQHDFDDDLKQLVKEYDRVEPLLKLEGGKLRIELKLKSKPKISAIDWIGTKEVPIDKLQKELGIQPGSVFDRVAFNKAFHKLKAFYIKKGYFSAELDYKVKLGDKLGEVTVEITVKEGEAGFIKEIVFDGFTKKEENIIEELIFTKEYSFFTSWLTNEGTLRREVLKHDEMTILNFIQNEGYLDAKLNVVIENTKDKARVIIRFTLDRGSLYSTGKVAISGAEEIIQNDKLLALMPIKEGGIYSADLVRSSARAIYDALGSKGYVDAQVTPESKRVSGEYQYNVSFVITPFDRYRVGLIKVLGNHRTDASVILHETLLVPGEVFNTTLIQKSEERLRNVGYFKNVNIFAVKASAITASGAHFRDIHIEVDELPTTANFGAFVAFSTAENLSGGINITESNFNIQGIPHIFTKGLRALRGGGEYVGMNATIGTKQLSYTLSWTKPYFMDSAWAVGVDFTKQRNSFASDDYTLRSYGVHLAARRTINAFLKFGTHYRLKHSSVKLKHIRHSRRNREVWKESRNGGLISAAGTELYYDSTNHPRAPTRGLRSTLSVEFAGLGGDHTFISMGYLNSFYWAPYERGLFRFRANVQFIKTLGSTHPKDLPLDERLYAGGESSIRGFVFNRVGPKFRDKERTVRGGMSEVLLSSEYKQYLFKKLDAFVFFDAGNVYFREFYLAKLRASTGYGLKLKIMENAPLTIGMGYPLNPASKRDVKKFFMLFESSF